MIKKDIFKRMRSGEAVPMNDPDYGEIREAVNRTFGLPVTYLTERLRWVSCQDTTAKMGLSF